MNQAENKIKILEDILTSSEFDLPIQQLGNTHFPEFLRSRLDRYKDFIEETVLKKINEEDLIGRDGEILQIIKKLSDFLIEVIDLYYKGELLESIRTFNDALDYIFYHDAEHSNIEGINLYRARRENGVRFTKEDLFHIKFEERHLVASNRFSIPGFPALYLGGSTYVCWEEFNRYNLRDLQFSRFRNTRNLKIIKLQRGEDFLTDSYSKPNLKQLDILPYIVTFPLMIASSIKTKYPKGNFKAEYIIPQLLLQYVSKNSEIDGIKFLSTRVDYSRLKMVDAYNYVFPVKTKQETGFCSRLVDLFEVTESTSLMLEEIKFNTRHAVALSEFAKGRGQIDFTNNDPSDYSTTAFGRIEEALDDIGLSKIDNPPF